MSPTAYCPSRPCSGSPVHTHHPVFSSGYRAITEEHAGGHGVGHGEGDGVGTQCSTRCRNIYSTWQRTGCKTHIRWVEGKNSLVTETWAWHIVDAQQTSGRRPVPAHFIGPSYTWEKVQRVLSLTLSFLPFLKNSCCALRICSREDRVAYFLIYLPISLFLIQKGLKAAQHKPHMEPESVSWLGRGRAGRQNRPVSADVGLEPCPESSPIWPQDSEMGVEVSVPLRVHV